MAQAEEQLIYSAQGPEFKLKYQKQNNKQTGKSQDPCSIQDHCCPRPLLCIVSLELQCPFSFSGSWHHRFHMVDILLCMPL
jgi:hypothetical protein